MHQSEVNFKCAVPFFTHLPGAGISADILRILALFCMLLDHMWATIISGNQWMTCVGRLAFPIFAFQLTEGFLHTSDRKRYAKRLFLFALISEIPFDLVQASTVFYPFHQNIMFTLLLGLIALSGAECIRSREKKDVLFGSAKILTALLLSTVGFVDYGPLGILMILIFYVFRFVPLTWLWQLISMALLNIFLFEGETIPFMLLGAEQFFPIQGFAVFALLPIWLYNGKKGTDSRAFQYGCYLFYPLHLLILYLIFSLR